MQPELKFPMHERLKKKNLDELRDILHKGVLSELTKAEQSYRLANAIGEYVDDIYKIRLEQIFLFVQPLLIDSYILNLSRLYEEPKKKYKIRSIRTALNFIKKNLNDDYIQERSKTIMKIKICIPNYIPEKDTNLTEFLCNWAADTINKKEACLNKIRTIRDKVIAHPEKIDYRQLPDLVFDETKDLIEFAKNFSIIAGCIYISFMYWDLKDNTFSMDVSRPAWALKDLISRLKKLH